MAEKSKKRVTASDARSTALRHARDIEEKKRLKARVADLVLEAYDLPTPGTRDPTDASAADVSLFLQCLSLFQPSDFDDLVHERNIDDRCGYALCPKPNLKIVGAGEKIWNQKSGKDFKIVDRADMEKWCSKTCGDRAAFVRVQLSSEPSWLRDSKIDVRLLDQAGRVDDLSSATKSLAETDVSRDVVERLQALSLERGDETMKDVSDQVQIAENMPLDAKSMPPSRGEQLIEGYAPRKVRFVSDGATARMEN